MGQHHDVIAELREPTHQLRVHEEGHGQHLRDLGAGRSLPRRGGSASIYGPRAWAAFEEFSDAESVGAAPEDVDGV